jgi:hypothetical protein
MTANGSGPAPVATGGGPGGIDQLGGLITQTDSSAAPQAFPIGFIYFLEQPSLARIKIGSTCNPTSRLKHLASWMPEPPVILGLIPGGASEEMRWHERWAALRVHREWFTANDELRKAIAAACQSAGVAS